MHLGFEVCYVRNFTDVDDKVSVCLLSSCAPIGIFPVITFKIFYLLACYDCNFERKNKYC